MVNVSSSSAARCGNIIRGPVMAMTSWASNRNTLDTVLCTPQFCMHMQCQNIASACAVCASYDRISHPTEHCPAIMKFIYVFLEILIRCGTSQHNKQKKMKNLHKHECNTPYYVSKMSCSQLQIDMIYCPVN